MRSPGLILVGRLTLVGRCRSCRNRWPSEARLPASDRKAVTNRTALVVQYCFYIVGMFPNIPVAKTLEVTREELENDETLSRRTKWKIDDIMKLLEISIETYFKTIDGKIYY